MTLRRPAALLALALLVGAADEKPPAAVETIAGGQALSILGRSVEGPGDEQVGRIVDVLVDDAGQPRAAVIDTGGFMGVGNRKIAVVWRALHFLPAADNHRIRIDMTEDQIKAIPEFKPSTTSAGPPMSVAAPPPAAPGPASAGQ